MKCTFNDLFDEKDNILTAKKTIRLGAMRIPSGHSFDAEDPALGVPLYEWKDKQFEVDIDGDGVVIKQIM